MATDAAARLAALSSSAPAAADLVDALAEALLELPLTLEVHVRRLPDAGGLGFTAAYWPGRSRSYIAASWDSGALREAVAVCRPVATGDPAALPAGLVGRLTSITGT